MLTAIAAAILIVLVVVGPQIDALVKSVREASLCSECHGSGHAPDAPDPEEPCPACGGSGSASGGMSMSLGQIQGELDEMHDTILKLWACPACFGDGSTSEWDETSGSFKKCHVCKGTGRRNPNQPSFR